MRLMLKAVGVTPVWVAAHCQVFPANAFIRGRDPQQRLIAASARPVKDAWRLSTVLSALKGKMETFLKADFNCLEKVLS